MKKGNNKKGISTSRGLNRNRMIDEIIKFATMPVDGKSFVKNNPYAPELFRGFLKTLDYKKISDLYKDRGSGDLKYLLISFCGSYVLAFTHDVPCENIPVVISDIDMASMNMVTETCKSWHISFMTAAFMELSPSYFQESCLL